VKYVGEKETFTKEELIDIEKFYMYFIAEDLQLLSDYKKVFKYLSKENKRLKRFLILWYIIVAATIAHSIFYCYILH
jgi:predicted nucleic acid-binding Zn ribbon protein